MDGSKTLTCPSYGEARPSFACSHSIDSLRTGLPKGLNALRDDDGNFNGWCDECDRVLAQYGGEWNDESEALAKIGMICEGCFLRVAEINGIERLN
jgi:hypothetical protein